MSKEDFSITQDSGHLSIVLSTAKFGAQVAEAFNEAVRQKCDKEVDAATIDMKAVEFIDSSGVGALLALRKRLPADSPAITLQGPQPGIVSVLEMLRLHRIFKLVEA